MTIHMILGGASSGKTRYAQQCAQNMAVAQNPAQQKSLHYVATARLWDDEMRAKAKIHQQQRATSPINWHTHEADRDIISTLQQRTDQDVILIDSVSLWVSNVLLDEAIWANECRDLLDALRECSATIFVVADEVGASIVPDNALARRFRIANGETNQMIAEAAQTVEMIIAGLAQKLK